MKPTSILILSVHGYVSAEPELGKPETGGQVAYILELAKRFSRLGCHVDLVTRRFDEQAEFDVVNEHFRVWRIPFGGNKFIRKEDMHDYLDEFVSNFLLAIRKCGQRYDLVYSHYWDAGWAGKKISQNLGIPHIHSPHSPGWLTRSSYYAEKDMDKQKIENVYRFDERLRKEQLIYQTSDHIIVTTKLQSNLLQEQYQVSERRFTVIPPGLDINRFIPIRSQKRESLRQCYNLQPHDVLILGRMAFNKGYDLIIKAVPTLIDLVPDARLVTAIGSINSKQDDEGVAELKTLASELDIADRVVWLQYIPDEDLANYYRAAGVFALPSRYEVFGMVAIEAMACGTPTVITVQGGLFDLIDFGTHALYADPNRPVEYGTMLAMPLLYPNLAHKLSIAGSRFARCNFDWNNIAKRIMAVFDQVLSGKAHSV